jgi:tripartite-type tricarboxylate transporter receptor subunit TctC
MRTRLDARREALLGSAVRVTLVEEDPMLRTPCAMLLLLAAMLGVAQAQEPYPTRPITIVVAFPPGGLADNTARPVAAALEHILKQPVVVSNKPGAAGAVGNQFVATAKPDGYTLLMALVSVSVLPEVDKLFERPPTYTRDQLTGIARINADPSMLVVRADTPWKTLKDFVDDAKKRPGEIVFSSSGLYGASHVPMEMAMHATGIRLRHLPTTGGGPMMNALLGGHAQATMAPASLAVGQVKAGKLRLLAHTGAGPVPAFPEVPSLKSLGYDVEYTAWAGLVAPKATPPHVVRILRDAVRQAVKAPEVVNAHAKLETPIAYQDADEFNAWWAQDAARLAEVVKKIGKVESAK